ncbi:hypothetical protein PR202_ga04444 [Eleusine coracana subsp. coracana]|uniref:Uncharacterized protein n=1 Tax=Eleusine coracana subsp. coracana TaxID=191504 RepID=A0AAV5BQC4_ELECO|nr:hypothetical protein PR202_ga04444 [Eleusine coracana subsp. coracana]
MDARLGTGSDKDRSPEDAALPPSSELQAAEMSSSSTPPDAETRRAEEEDDEKVERFYALLANIRSMRGVFGTTTTTGKRKRTPARGSCDVPPWRPAFKMEDFESEDARGSKQKRGFARTMPAASEKSAVVAPDSDNDNAEGASDGVEQSGPRRAAARRRFELTS